jgi:hypothetical protein
MIQLISADTAWMNSVSKDFKMFRLDESSVIEITGMDETKIISCVKDAMINFGTARKKYNAEIPVNFKTTRKIVYNLLCYFEFRAIGTHIKVNREVYGDNISFYKEVLLGVITAPLKLIKNVVFKKILKK